MKYSVIIQPKAETNIEEAYDRIAKDTLQHAVRWYNGIIKAIKSLEQFPERCPLAPENDVFEEEIHQMLYGKRAAVYRILFTIPGNTVYVLHVRHCARDYKTDRNDLRESYQPPRSV